MKRQSIVAIVLTVALLATSTTIARTIKNKSPIVNAGPDQTISATSTVLNGSATDSDGTVVAYRWREMSGPNDATWGSTTDAVTAISGLIVGTYKMRLIATDNDGATNSDDVVVTVTNGGSTGNQAPTANAGADQTITLPTNSVSLSGSGADSDGTIASYAWSEVSGPNAATLNAATSATTTASNLIAGTYVFRLVVTDNAGATGTDDVNIVVNPAPTSSGSGPYGGIAWTIPGTVQAENFDTGGEGVAYHDATTGNTGTKYRTTEDVDIESSIDTGGGYDVGWIYGGEWINYTVSVTSSGTYTFTARVAAPNAQSMQLKVDGTTVATVPIPSTGGWQNWTTVTVPNITLPAGTHVIQTYAPSGGYNLNYFSFTSTTTTPNNPPTANAGVDQTITLPTSSTTLSGSGADSDGTIASYAWSQVSGPNTATIVSATSASTSVSNLVQGTYTFRLKVTDNAGATASDDMNIIVNPAPVPPPSGSGPYGGTAWAIPGTIQAEDFDLGGEGVGYHDTTAGNYGTMYRPSENVDLELATGDSSGTYNVGWVAAGEWMKYTVNAQSSGVYTFSARTASPYAGKTLQVEIDGAILATLTVPQTGGWQSWQTVSAPTFSLAAGKHALRIIFTDGSVNLNYVSFATDTVTPNQSPSANAGTDQTITLPTNSVTLSGSGTDSDGTIASYAWTKVSGATAIIAAPSSASTAITGLTQGTYTFRLTVTDNAGATGTDDVSIIVNASTGCVTPGTTNLPPDAGMPEYDMILNPGQNSATITAHPTDPECQGIASYVWKVTPAPTSINGLGTPTITITGLKPGVHYGVSLTVRDNGLPTDRSLATYSASESILVFVANSLTPSEATSGLTLQAIRNNEVRDMVTAPAQQPPTTHPRLFGSAQQFEQDNMSLDTLPCSTLANNTLGNYINLRNMWDLVSKGYQSCKTGTPSIATNALAAPYYAATPPAWDGKNTMNAMFLLRRLMACYDQGHTDCLYSKTDYEDFRTRFINYEMNEFKTNWVYGEANATKCCRWTYGFAIYDIYSGGPFRYWNTFLDLAWNYLSDSDRKTIQDEMSFRIDGWLNQVRTRHWSYANGNNWNGNESQGLVAWAITNWYEDPVRAKQVLTTVIDALWLHRDSFLDTGYYSEGLSYAGVSLSPIFSSVRMVTTAFNQTFHSMKWDYFPKLSSFYLDNFSPDGHTTDFGDAHLRSGWSETNPLLVQVLGELFRQKPIGSTAFDPCIAQEFFKNQYFGGGFDNAWEIYPALARDWQAIGSNCTNTRPAYGTTKVSVDAEGGQTSLRTYLTGTTQAATQTSTLRWEEADETYLNASSTPSSFPHRELDFGGLIWAVHGSRLLWDWGYGNILSVGTKTSARPDGDMYDLTKNLDFLPFSTNTLYIPDAKDTDSTGAPIPNTDRSQFYQSDGTTTPITVSGYSGALLDGSVPYGSQETLGWMKTFNRILLPIWDGHFLVIDSVRLKDGKASRVAENFYTYKPSVDDMTITGCNYDRNFSVEAVITAANVATFTPRCMQLYKNILAEGRGSIVGASLTAGSMHLDPTTYQLSTASNAERRTRIYWDSDGAVTKDLRIFALVAGNTKTGLPSASIVRTTCATGYICFKVTIGTQARTLRFSETNDRYILEAFE